MRKLAFVSLALLCIGAAPPPATSPAPATPPADAQPSLDRMNVMRDQPGCTSIARQVSGEDRRYDATRLDQQPPGRLILAVDRQVDGCREVTFANGQQRSARPLFPTQQ
jgi:hypothetical protein